MLCWFRCSTDIYLVYYCVLRQAYEALGLYHGVSRTFLNPASVSSHFKFEMWKFLQTEFVEFIVGSSVVLQNADRTAYCLQMKIFTRLDKVAEAVKGYNLDVMPDNTSATLQQVNRSFVAALKLQYWRYVLTFCVHNFSNLRCL